MDWLFDNFGKLFVGFFLVWLTVIVAIIFVAIHFLEKIW
jgi:hypothetical protein